MRRVSLLASVAAFCTAAMFMSLPASAADVEVPPEAVADTSNWYVSVHGGIKFGEDWDDNFSTHCGDYCEKEWDGTLDTDNGWRFGGAVGFLFSEIFAIEGELAYMNQDFDELSIDDHHLVWEGELDGDVSIFTGMVNLIAGVPVGGFLRPYIGGGVGFAHISLDSDFDVGSLDDDDTTFAAQAFAGVDFGLTENVALGIRGRLLHIGDLDFADDFDCDHEIDVDLIKSVEAVLTVGF